MQRRTVMDFRAATSSSHLAHSAVISAGSRSPRPEPRDQVSCSMAFVRMTNGLGHPRGSYNLPISWKYRTLYSVLAGDQCVLVRAPSCLTADPSWHLELGPMVALPTPGSYQEQLVLLLGLVQVVDKNVISNDDGCDRPLFLVVFSGLYNSKVCFTRSLNTRQVIW